MSRDSELDQNLSGDLRKKFSSDLNEIRYVGRGRWVMHNDMPYGQNQGQGQGHSREVDRQSPTGLIFKNCYLNYLHTNFLSFWHSRSSFSDLLTYFHFQVIICVILDSNLSDFLFSVYFLFAFHMVSIKSKCVHNCLGFDESV